MMLQGWTEPFEPTEDETALREHHDEPPADAWAV
jgi:hypothetical protein